MWEHPATQVSIQMLLERSDVRLVGPGTGPLAAGDEGVGRMAEPEDVLAAAEEIASKGRDLAGFRIVVTAGPTWEPIDPVRFIGNRSTGKMGFAVAAEATARGADVRLVVGPGTGDPPEGIVARHVGTAEELREAVVTEAGRADAVVMAAAVADFRPDRAASGKLKKETGPPELRLVPTPDILAELGRSKGRRVLVGFAAETGELEETGREKLRSKALDVLVVNEVGRKGTGFGADTDHAMILAADGQDEPLRMWTKRELASAICDRLAKLLRG